MAKSIKTNFFYNMVNTITQLVFPFITFPYAARVMMADGIGQVNFYISIIQYIILLSSIGIPLYALRETARVRNNPEELNKTCIEIIFLHALLTIAAYIVVFVLCFSIGRIHEDIPLFLILSLEIILTAIGCNWLFQGVEDFKYIAIRSLIVRVVSCVLLFLFVKTKDDLLLYGLYSVVTAVGGNVFNLYRMRMYVHPLNVHLKDLHPFRHLNPCLRIFALNLIVSIYVHLDIVMLGFMKGDAAVGFYTAANRMVRIAMTLVTSLSTVMLPRLANLVSEGLLDEFVRLSKKSVDVVVTIGLPMIAGLIICAPQIIHLFCGGGYEPAILNMQVLASIVLIIPLSNLIGMQILYPQDKEIIVIKCTAIGAATNFLLNVILIPLYSNQGAAVATICAELSVTLSMYMIGRKYIPFSLFSKEYIPLIIAILLMSVTCLTVSSFIDNDVLSLTAIVPIGMFVYGLCLLYTKNLIAMETVKIIRRYKKQ